VHCAALLGAAKAKLQKLIDSAVRVPYQQWRKAHNRQRQKVYRARLKARDSKSLCNDVIHPTVQTAVLENPEDDDWGFSSWDGTSNPGELKEVEY